MMASHSLPSGVDAQRPGEAEDEFTKRPGETDAELAVRMIALVQKLQQKNEEIQQEERRQKEEQKQQNGEIQQQKEKLLELWQQQDELQRRMEKQPFLRFVDYMEDLVFSSLIAERPRKKSGEIPASVSGKMYPRTIRPWAGFAEQHTETFATLRDTLGNAPRFPSPVAIEMVRDGLCKWPRLANTSRFVDVAIETPVAEIVTEYLNTARPEVNRMVHFQNNEYQKPLIRVPSAEQSSPTKELQPDRWCLVYELIEMDGEQEEVDDKTVNILVGEIKPPFKLPAATLANVLSIMRHDTFFQDAIEQTPVSEEDSGAAEAPTNVPGHVLVAQALCEAYDYMIGSGCQYGYIASGESLVFLHVEDDRSLVYHSISFLVPAVRDAKTRRQQNRGLRQPHETAVAYLASLCLWAVGAAPRSFTWIDAATETAQRWPDSKKEGKKGSSRKPDGSRSDDDDDDDDVARGDDDRTIPSGPLTALRIAMPSRPRKRGRSPARRRQGEQSQGDANEAAALELTPKTRALGPFPVEPPTLPYCTQACLRGLVQGLALDNSCPNVALHRDARRLAEGRSSPSGICSDDVDDADVHPLTASALRARMVFQLAANMDKDCQCTAPLTGKARHAKFFKLALTGFGYTFVGKGVRAVSRKVLEHEAVVYNAVPQLQGFLIPVFLGIIDLERPIPMPDMARIANIMLMSYAGPDLTLYDKLPSDIDVTREMDRSTRDLERAGIDNPDVREANVAWNAEVQRAMHFDFDRVFLRSLPAAPKDKVNHPERGSDTKRVKTEPDVAASGVRSPLLSRAGSNVMDDAVSGTGDDLAKKALPTTKKAEQYK